MEIMEDAVYLSVVFTCLLLLSVSIKTIEQKEGRNGVCLHSCDDVTFVFQRTEWTQTVVKWDGYFSKQVKYEKSALNETCLEEEVA